MEKKEKITNVINLLNYETEVADSYKWENKDCRNTFPANQWIPIFMDFLSRGKSTSNIEKEYIKYMLNVKKSTNEMYINSLLRKFYLPHKINIEKMNKFSYEEIENWIINHINFIINKHYKKAVPKAKKWMKEWQKYINDSSIEKINSLSNEEINKNITQTIKNYLNTKINSWEKISLKKINFSKLVYKEKNKIQNLNLNNDKKEKVGILGEKLFYSVLVNKYGYQNVIHESNINKFSPYDFEVNDQGKTIFFEVKSTIRNTMNFFLSRAELEFSKNIKKDEKYSLIFLKNVNLQKNASFAPISEIENPQFEINMNCIGIQDEKILISPTNFKGMI